MSGQLAEENIGARLRNLLSAESAANDGAALTFVLLAIYMLTKATGVALEDWVLHVVLWDMLGGVAIGLAIGAAAGYLERWSEEEDYLDEAPMLAVTVALSLSVLGLGQLIGSDGILAVFAAHGATSTPFTRWYGARRGEG